MDNLLNSLHDQSGGIFNQIVTSNQEAPSTEKIYTDLPHPREDELTFMDQKCYVDNLKELTGNDDDDIFRKRMFIDGQF